MRRRPPLTVLACIALIAAIVVLGCIEFGARPAWLLGCVVLGGGAVGMYLGIRTVWFFVIAFQVVNALAGVRSFPNLPYVMFHVAVLGLLLAPPTRRHFRRDPATGAETPSAARRVLGRTGAVLAGLMLGLGLYVALLAPGPVSGDLELARGDRPGLRVLFVGTTLTSDHAMPQTVGRLASSDRGAPPIFAVQYAQRGSRLEESLQDDRLTELLDGERWDLVVLQEHSQTIARPADRATRTLPAARALDGLAKRSGAGTVLFANPGYERGDRGEVPGDSFASMQARLAEGHRELAAALPAALAPVSLAWEQARRELPRLDLWGDDGIRPTEAGSYLTACVIYAVLARRDPQDGRFDAGLDPGEAQQLRRVAAQAVGAPLS